MMDFVQTQLPLALFYLFCAMAVVSSFGVILLKNPVSSAFSLIFVLLNVAGIFAMQEAYFISAVQVLVYAGAIMVLFVFVIMLLSVEQVEVDWPSSKGFWPIPVALALVLCAGLVLAFTKGQPVAKLGEFTPDAIAHSGGNVRVVSEVMFSDYVMPFLTVGMLLSICIVGAVLLAKRKVE